MGMFNWVEGVEVDCPKCEKPMDGWQTKDDEERELVLDFVHFTTVKNFYTSCDSCHLRNSEHVWVEFTLPDGAEPIFENYQRHAEAE